MACMQDHEPKGGPIPCPSHVAFKWEKAGPLGEAIRGPSKEQLMEDEAKTLFQHMDTDGSGLLR